MLLVLQVIELMCQYFQQVELENGQEENSCAVDYKLELIFSGGLWRVCIRLREN